MSAVANTKALEIGLHHDGKQSTGNPLETQMRRRVFWCVFMLRKYILRLGKARTDSTDVFLDTFNSVIEVSHDLFGETDPA